jgi:hypothetical protein
MASGSDRAGSWAEKTGNALLVCARYGGAYGAGLGAASGLILGYLSLIGPVGGLVIGTLAGGLCGAIGGGLFCITGTMIRGRAGWILAGLLGGAVFPVWFWCVPAGKEGWDPFVIVVSIASIFLGGFLGHALNEELRGGDSGVPGMRDLARIIVGRNQTHAAPTDDFER